MTANNDFLVSYSVFRLCQQLFQKLREYLYFMYKGAAIPMLIHLIDYR